MWIHLSRKSVNNGKQRASTRLISKTMDCLESIKQKEPLNFFSIQRELSKIHNLKFIDGKFITCYNWIKILDVYGNQYASKWHLVLSPQIEKIMHKRQIPTMHLNPRATLDFLSTIVENGANFVLLKEDLIPLLENKAEAPWLESWQLQFQTIGGRQIAATLIQANWRGYAVSSTFSINNDN